MGASNLTATVAPFIQNVLSVVTLLDLVSYAPEQASVTDGDAFDFIIVGGGTAGCILANRLTEIEDFNVLMIEAGGEPPIESVLPGFFPLIPHSIHDWDFKSTNDNYTGQHLRDQAIPLTAGKMLGGSSALDHEFYIRGCPDDYAAWVEASGDESWSWDNLLYYFKKIEDVTATDVLQSEYGDTRGTNGYLKLQKEPHDIVKDYLSAFEELGHKILVDTDGEHILGYSEVLFSNRENQRQSNAYAYLRPIKDRKNLHVLKNSLVTKIVIEGNITKGVNVQLSNDSTIFLEVNNEVIVSAGVFNSAKLLMLSGIGPKEHLESLNIDVIADLPVGQYLHDHPQVPFIHRMKKTLVPELPIDPFHFPEPGLTGFVSLNKSKTQPDYQTLHVHFYHDAIVELLLCVVAFSTEDAVCDKIFAANTGHHTLYTFFSFMHPKSRGRVTLKSTDYNDPPIIEVGYFTDKDDIELFAQSLQDYSRIINTTYFNNSKAQFVEMDLPECEGMEVGSIEYWRCYAVALSTTTLHPSSTCSMGKVVDANLKVKGIQNLRVADASVMPSTISGNIKSAVNVIAEKLSDLIKIDYVKSTTSIQPGNELKTESLLSQVVSAISKYLAKYFFESSTLLE